MANDFSKEERVAFDDVLEGVQDALVLGNQVSVYNTGATEMERSGDVVHLPVPYIAQDVDGTPGTDISALYKDYTQLTVPAVLNRSRTVPFKLNSKELRDQLQEKRLGKAAMHKLASVINQRVLDAASDQGTLVVTSSTAATGFDDVAEIEAIMNEQGVPGYDRCLALNTRDYNAMAGNLAGRENIGSDITSEAYRRAYVGPIASFDTFKMDYGKSLSAAAGSGDTIDTTAGAADYTPVATDANGNNVDNRTQTVTVSNTTGVTAGDCLTIAGCLSVHGITKSATDQLKTFRVESVPNGTSLVISPPIIAASSSPTDAELQYKNCELVTTSATAAITYINTTTATTNVFWQKDAIKLIPGRYANDPGAGSNILKASTDNGIEVVMEKQRDIDFASYKYRIDVFFGVVNLLPEMSGIALFNQA